MLSVLMPVYNERRLVGECLRRVLAAPLPPGVEREIVVVDDGSTDGSAEILLRAARDFPGLVRVLRHERNRGKGAAIRTALAAAVGDVILVQDGDLEYDPSDYPALLEPILSGRADAVFGSRFLNGRRQALNAWHYAGNRALTSVSNAFTGLALTDMWTGYKAVRASFLRDMPLRRDGFSVEPELIAKLAKRRCRIQEAPIRYRARGYAEGKKIGLRDALESLGVILWFWLFDDAYGDERWDRRILRQLDKARSFNDWMADAVRGSLGDEVLEIGGGTGNVTDRLCPRSSYFVTDSDPLYCLDLERRFSGRPRVKALKVDITNGDDFTPLASSVDTVLCLNVLEHIDDDLAALINMRGALRSGGRLVLLVPNLPFAYGSIDELAGHRRRYLRPALRALLGEAGYDVESIADFNRVSLPAWIWNGRVLRRTTFGSVQLRVFDSLVWLFRRIDRFLPWPGQSLIAVARAA